MIRHYQFTGYLTKVLFHNLIGQPLDIGTGIGHHFQGFFRYDTNTLPDQYNKYRGPNFHLDALIYNSDGSINDRTHGSEAYAMLNPGPAPLINEPPFPPPTFGVNTQGSTSTYWGIWLGDNTGNLLTDTKLPKKLPDLSKWHTKIFWFAIDGQGFLLGEIDTLVLLAPAPPLNLRIHA